MPWVAALALVGTLSIAGLPPFNGFVSEWLLLQSFLYTPQIPSAFINMLVPLGAAALALTAALAAYVMVKFYGVIFLGQPREADLVDAHDANWLERLGLGWLALGCILFGILPQFAIGAAGAVTQHLLSQAVRPGSTMWWIAPISPEQASYSGLSGCRHHICIGTHTCTRAHAPHSTMGLRISVANSAYAGFSRRIWATDSPHVRWVLSY